MVFIERKIIGKKKWEFDSMYNDNFKGGKKREKEYAKLYKRKDNNYKYRITWHT